MPLDRRPSHRGPALRNVARSDLGFLLAAEQKKPEYQPFRDDLDAVAGDPDQKLYATHRGIARRLSTDEVAIRIRRALADRQRHYLRDMDRFVDAHADLCAMRDEFDERRTKRRWAAHQDEE